jgi:hypothetical protein
MKTTCSRSARPKIIQLCHDPDRGLLLALTDGGEVLYLVPEHDRWGLLSGGLEPSNPPHADALSAR